jgi:hypothetical protein
MPLPGAHHDVEADRFVPTARTGQDAAQAGAPSSTRHERNACLEEAWRMVTGDLVHPPNRHGVAVFALHAT